MSDIIVITVTVENARSVSDSLHLIESLIPLPEPAAKPFFIAVSGLPGTGKSYLCRQLVNMLPAVLLESDALRKTLYASPDYSPEESSRLFKTIHLLIEKLLSKGVSVILDATNLTEKNREYLYNIADRLNVKLILARVTAPPEIVSQRLQRRRSDSANKSDADWEVYRKMQSTEDQIRRKHYVVDTSHDISSVVNKITAEALR